MAKLLVNADDYGLHTAVNEAIKDCVNFGSVNAISVITNGKAPDYLPLLAMQKYGIKVGAHITWVGEPWLTADRYFKDWQALISASLLDSGKLLAALETEAQHQIRELVSHGIKPDHIDSHQHVHMFPKFWQIAKKLQTAYRIPLIRVTKVANPSSLRMSVGGIVLNQLASAKFNPEKDYLCAGVRHAGNYNNQSLQHELVDYKGRDTMLIVHPGKDNAALNKQYAHWHFDWEKEYQALMNQSFLDNIQQLGFDMVGA